MSPTRGVMTVVALSLAISVFAYDTSSAPEDGDTDTAQQDGLASESDVSTNTPDADDVADTGPATPDVTDPGPSPPSATLHVRHVIGAGHRTSDSWQASVVVEAPLTHLAAESTNYTVSIGVDPAPWSAQAMLARLVEERWLEPRAVVGFFGAGADGDDVVLFEDAAQRTTERARFRFLRQQGRKSGERPNACLADFVAPVGGDQVDWLGTFAVTVGHGVAERAAAFEAAHDDYSAILLKALADRLAEALAVHLHRRVRTTLWG